MLWRARRGRDLPRLPRRAVLSWGAAGSSCASAESPSPCREGATGCRGRWRGGTRPRPPCLCRGPGRAKLQ
eukprot:16437364-Heterocapsa_arctica.AAC.1